MQVCTLQACALKEAPALSLFNTYNLVRVNLILLIPKQMIPGIGKQHCMWMMQKVYITNCIMQGINLFQKRLCICTQDGKHIKAFIVRDPDGHAMLMEENVLNEDNAKH